MGLACKLLLEVFSEAMGLEKEAVKKASVDMEQKIVVNFHPKCPQPVLTLGLKRHTITLWLQYLSNGRFKSADHQAVVNSSCSHLSIATFQNPAQEGQVFNVGLGFFPILKVEEGEKAVVEEPISFAEMYRRKRSNLEIAKLKMLAKEKQLQNYYFLPTRHTVDKASCCLLSSYRHRATGDFPSILRDKSIFMMHKKSSQHNS
uniref:Naringenin,2-oxoglutarate 3-dioxygenase n=1 Tax=Cajanus cajan TaxID=3821 RepID=A0A151T018_CAJCA|nr:Naringenin,2-oxoglutarate 3-dioxygenase [Cajanus cajan]